MKKSHEDLFGRSDARTLGRRSRWKMMKPLRNGWAKNYLRREEQNCQKYLEEKYVLARALFSVFLLANLAYFGYGWKKVANYLVNLPSMTNYRFLWLFWVVWSWICAVLDNETWIDAWTRQNRLNKEHFCLNKKGKRYLSRKQGESDQNRIYSEGTVRFLSFDH